jgi:hypothetical protein
LKIGFQNRKAIEFVVSIEPSLQAQFAVFKIKKGFSTFQEPSKFPLEKLIVLTLNKSQQRYTSTISLQESLSPVIPKDNCFPITSRRYQYAL